MRRHADYLEKTFDLVLSGMKDGEWRAGNFLDWPTRHNDKAAWAGTQGLALVTARETAFLADVARQVFPARQTFVGHGLRLFRFSVFHFRIAVFFQRVFPFMESLCACSACTAYLLRRFFWVLRRPPALPVCA